MAIDNPYDAPAGDLRAARRSRWLFWLATLGVGGLIVVALLLPMSRPGASKLARRIACALNLRLIALALRAYDEQHGSLPPACTRDAHARVGYSSSASRPARSARPASNRSVTAEQSRARSRVIHMR